MIRRVLLICFACILLAGVASTATAYTHVAREGESLDQLAVFYYGSEKFSMVIRAANGFMHPDDGSLLQGERVEIPELIYHRVQKGEDWYGLSNQYLGTAKRATFLSEMNGMPTDAALPEGKIIRIPFQLLYILAPDETVKSVARMFLGKEYSSDWLRGYNLKRKKKFGRGDALLVPLINVEFTDAAKDQIAQNSADRASKEDQNAQINAMAQIGRLRDAFNDGHYVEIVSIAQRLLGTEKLTTPQKIGVYKYLAFAYVAFGETALARAAFRNALKLQPTMELSPITTSPKIMEVFNEMRKELEVEISD